VKSRKHKNISKKQYKCVYCPKKMRKIPICKKCGGLGTSPKLASNKVMNWCDSCLGEGIDLQKALKRDRASLRIHQKPLTFGKASRRN